MQLANMEFIILGIVCAVGLGAIGLLYYLVSIKGVDTFARGLTVQVDEFEIHYTVQGQGQPILLVHGLGASLYSWSDLAKLLAADFKVISLDLPGFGRSSKLVGVEYGLDSQVARIEKFLDAIGIDQCFLIGNSMGGNLVLWLGKLHPERFPYVCAIAPAAHPKLVPWGIQRLGFLSRPASYMYSKAIATWMHRQTLGMPDRLDQRRVLQTMNIYKNNPMAIRTFLGAMAAIADPRILSETFESRVLLLWGEKDRIVKRWAIDKLLPRIPEAKFFTHPNGGHQLQEDDPEWIREKLLRFFPRK